MQTVRDHKPDPERRQLYRAAMAITLLGNLLLAAGKAAAAYLSGSVALFADAANSASDVVYSLTIVLGLWMAQQPPDPSHPQGHSRFEPVVGLVVAASMTYAGYKAAVTAYERFVAGAFAIEPGLPTLVLLIAAAIKVGMYGAIRRIAAQLNSPTFATTARDNLSDVLTSSAAFVGAVGSKFILPLLDPIAGVAVALWIFRAAFGAWKENLAFLTGAGASAELQEQIARVAAEVPGVLEVHQVIAEYVGPQLVVDLHVNVAGTLALREAHQIADAVQAHVEALPEVDRAYVHVEPASLEWVGADAETAPEHADVEQMFPN